MTEIQPIKYRYAMNLKLSRVPARTVISAVFPNVEDLMFSSKTFDGAQEAVDSSSVLVKELTGSLNDALDVEQYTTLFELNPARSGKTSISSDWGDLEIAKIWIIDKVAQDIEPNALLAIGLAQVVEFYSDPVLVH
jgi:hypothetical protein